MPKNPGEIYEQVRDGVVAIHMDSGGGSGIVIGDNVVVTNCHVVDSGGPIMVGKVDPNGAWKPIEAQVIAANLGDLCLLQSPGLSAKPVNIGSAKDLRPGDAVYAMGAPFRLPLTFSGGFVSQLRGDPKLPPIVQTDAAISPGSSGGGLFNSEGQLVGITTFSKGGGQNLNFALPADWIESLRKEAHLEAPIRQELRECFKAGEFSKIPAVFPKAAGNIMNLRKDPAQRASIYGRIVRQEARTGNKDSKAAETITTWALSSDSPQEKDHVNFQAAWCFASVGNFRQAAKTAKQIKESRWQLAARAVISAEQAFSGDIEAAREYFGEIADVDDKQMDKNILWLLAWAFAEMAQVKKALDCMERIHQSGDFVGEIRTLSSIAGALARHNCTIGSTALFEFAHGVLAKNEKERKFLGRGERVLSLGFVAWEEAACGFMEKAQESVQEAMKIIAEGGIDHENYHMKIEALTRIAEVSAKIGHVDASIWAISRIPVLSDDFAVALAYVAIAMGRSS